VALAAGDHALALHLLQSALVHGNTLLLQRVLAEPAGPPRLAEADRRALPPLCWSNVTPSGRFRLELDRHLDPAPLAGRRTGPSSRGAGAALGAAGAGSGRCRTNERFCDGPPRPTAGGRGRVQNPCPQSTSQN